MLFCLVILKKRKGQVEQDRNEVRERVHESERGSDESEKQITMQMHCIKTSVQCKAGSCAENGVICRDDNQLIKYKF